MEETERRKKEMCAAIKKVVESLTDAISQLPRTEASDEFVKDIARDLLDWKGNLSYRGCPLCTN